MSDLPQPVKKPRGCLFYGCLTLVVVGLLSGIGSFFAVRYAVRQVKAVVEKYTETQPMTLQQGALEPEELNLLRDRVENFNRTLNQDPNTPPEISLTGEELNALLMNSPSLGPLTNQIRVRIESDVIRGTLSWPLDSLGPLKQVGRFLNGEAALNLSLTNGVLDVNVIDFKFRGDSLPAQTLAVLRGINLAEGAQKNPRVREQLERFESIHVADGKLVVKGKRKN